MARADAKDTDTTLVGLRFVFTDGRNRLTWGTYRKLIGKLLSGMGAAAGRSVENDVIPYDQRSGSALPIVSMTQAALAAFHDLADADALNDKARRIRKEFWSIARSEGVKEFSFGRADDDLDTFQPFAEAEAPPTHYMVEIGSLEGEVYLVGGKNDYAWIRRPNGALVRCEARTLEQKAEFMAWMAERLRRDVRLRGEFSRSLRDHKLKLGKVDEYEDVTRPVSSASELIVGLSGALSGNASAYLELASQMEREHE